MVSYFTLTHKHSLSLSPYLKGIVLISLTHLPLIFCSESSKRRKQKKLEKINLTFMHRHILRTHGLTVIVIACGTMAVSLLADPVLKLPHGTRSRYWSISDVISSLISSSDKFLWNPHTTQNFQSSCLMTMADWKPINAIQI